MATKESQTKSSISKANFLKFSSVKIPLARKLAYGIGGIPMQITTTSISFYITLFFLEVAKMPPFYFFYLIVIGRFWDAVSDPMAGYLVNITYTRWGHFKPYMTGALPFLILSYFGLFFNPDLSTPWKMFYFVIVMCLFQTSVTFYFISYGSMSMVLTSDSKQRDLFTAYRMSFEIIGILLGSALFGSIMAQYRNIDMCIGNQTMPPNYLKNQEKGYIIATSVCNVIIFISVLLAVFASIEEEIFTEYDKLDWNFYKNALTFKPYLLLMLTYACTTIGIMILQSNMALFITHVVKLSSQMTTAILVMVVLSVCLIPLAQYFISKFGKKITYFSGMITIIPVLISLLFIPSKPNLILFYLMMVWSSYPVMVACFLPWSMLPDCIDYFAVTYNIRKEAALFSLFSFFQKFALGISIGMTGIVLGMANYNSEKCVQPESVEKALRYFIAFGAFFFYSISMVSLYFYPLNEEKRIEIDLLIQKSFSNKRISSVNSDQQRNKKSIV